MVRLQQICDQQAECLGGGVHLCLARGVETVDQILRIGHLSDKVKACHRQVMQHDIELAAKVMHIAQRLCAVGQSGAGKSADQRPQHLVLVLVGIVERLAAYSRLLREVSHAGALHAIARKHPHCGIQDIVFGFYHDRHIDNQPIIVN